MMVWIFTKQEITMSPRSAIAFAIKLVLCLNANTGFAAELESAKLTWANEVSGNFLNYEWKDPKVEGETYFNSKVKSVVAHEDGSFEVTLGALGIRNFGDEEKSGDAEPWVQLKLNIEKQLYFIMGSLNTDHNAHESLLAKHQIFEDLSEEGFQLRFFGQLVHSDFWLNWQRRETEKKAEQFAVGSINKLTTSYLDLDLQFLAHHIDGQKTEDKTSLRNNIALFGGTLKLPTPIQPLLGARVLSSGYKLNDGAESKGLAREMFTGLNITLPNERLLEARLSSVEGHDFSSLYGLKPYSLDSYKFFEIGYKQKFIAISNAKKFATFGFRARSENFAQKNHSTQEMSLAVNF
jgi:hypothetical protein